MGSKEGSQSEMEKFKDLVLRMTVLHIKRRYASSTRKTVPRGMGIGECINREIVLAIACS